MTLDKAATVEIERLVAKDKVRAAMIAELRKQLDESERQRKALAEQLERFGNEGINAATGAGR